MRNKVRESINTIEKEIDFLKMIDEKRANEISRCFSYLVLKIVNFDLDLIGDEYGNYTSKQYLHHCYGRGRK